MLRRQTYLRRWIVWTFGDLCVVLIEARVSVYASNLIIEDIFIYILVNFTYHIYKKNYAITFYCYK